MMMRRLFTFFMLFSSALYSATAQNNYLYATGSPVFSTSLPIDHGIVDVNNGEIHLEFPTATKQQRGDLKLNEMLTYDSRIWKIVQNGTSYSWQATNVPNSSGGWLFSSGIGSGAITYSTYGGSASDPPQCSNLPAQEAQGLQQYYNQYQFWTWTDASGVQHSFPSVSTKQYDTESWSYECTGTSPASISSSSGQASDGSGYVLQVTNYTTATILDEHGTVMHPTVNGSGPPNPNIMDRNGNYWSADGSGNLIDTSGSAPVLVSANGNQTVYSVLGVGGTRNRYTVTTTSVSYNTGFNETQVGEAAGTFTAVQSITLPDGSAYRFSYDSGTAAGHYGEMTSMTLPTGGLISYSYSNYMDSFHNENRWLTGIGKDGGTTLFTPAVLSQCSSSAGCQEATTVVGVDGNTSVYTFNLDKAALLNGSSWISGIKSYQGSASSGTLLRSTVSNYTYETYGAAVNGNNALFYQVPVALTNEVTLSDVGVSSQIITSFKPLTSDPAEVKVWNFGTSTSQAPDTDTVYQYESHEFPLSIVTSDNTGNRISQTTYGYDETSPSSVPSGLPNYMAVASITRGNQTSLHQWINTSGATLNSTMTYDAAGFMLAQTTPNGTTSFAPDASHTYVTKMTQPTPNSGALIANQSAYDTSTGSTISTIDENGNQTVYKTFDVLNRPTEIDYPDGGRTNLSYTSAIQSGIEQAIDTRANNTQMLADSYGRFNRKEVGNGQSTNPWFEADTCYDTSGRVSSQSYPYADGGFGSPPQCANTGNGIGGDAYAYDGLGRVKQVVHADGSAQAYNYKGRAVESVDENGVTKITQTDAFGRTTAVCEVSSNANLPASGSPANCGLDYPGTGFLTTYAYNDASHTTTVTQGAQTRVFTTDSLGRQVSTREPESGLTTYSYAYKSTGLLVTRVRPKANQASGATTTTNTQYDSLGRILDVTYSDGSPERVYVYDQTSGGVSANALGRLSQAATFFPAGTAATSFLYDTMGRTTQTSTCLPGQCNNYAIPIGYAYDHVGNLIAEGGPAIGTISYSYDLASNLATESLTPPNQATQPVVSNLQAGPFGPSSYQLGNGLYQVFQYDVDGRKDRGWTCRGSSQPQCTNGADLYGYGLDMKGSQLTDSSDSIMNNYNNYQYDEFNRLKALNGGAGGLSFSWVYDRYGNRWQQNGSGVGMAPQPQYSYNASNNRNTAYQYDDAGDVNNDVANGYSYDADGNSVTNGPTRYNYDALGNRFEKLPVSGDPTWYIYDAFGRQLEVVNGRTDALLETRLTLNGSPLAFLNAGGSLSFEHTDWLGTVRAISNTSGNFSSTFLSLPFGDGLTANGPDVDTGHFADLERDASTDTDHAFVRNYGEAAGRWMSPDPYSGSYDWSDPQSMNRYGYAANNPLALTDPTGQFTLGAGTATGCAFGPVGCAIGIGVDIGLGELLNNIFGGLFSGPSFHGSLKPRPNAQPWDEYNIHYGPNIAGALGLPDNTCEFGACGGGTTSFTNGSPYTAAGPILLPPTGLIALLRLFQSSNPLAKYPLNGNVFPGFQPQDGVCTTGPFAGPMNSNPATLSCCQAHDTCYTKYHCNASSFLPLGLPGACKVACNATVAACLVGSGSQQGLTF